MKSTWVVRFYLIIAILISLPLQIFAETKLTVYTVNYPLYYFTERIVGGEVDVVFPAPADVDPAFWTPDKETIKRYQKADLIILNGAGYAKWISKVSLPMLRLVDTSTLFKDNLIGIQTDVTHSHGPAGDHSHGGTAFTTWLDFSQAIQQAEVIYKALARRLPARKSFFLQNFEELKRDLLELDTRLQTMSMKKPGLPLFGSHPIYQYMARRYGLNMKMVLWEPDSDPGDTEWQNFRELIKEHPAKWMVWEAAPLTKSAKSLNKLSIHNQIFSPCFATPQHGDFLSVMQQNLKNMSIIFQEI